VERVGAYEASFVSSIGECERLDPRFRLPVEVWRALPVEYMDYAFAVFQLQPGHHRVHPMAYRYRPLDDEEIFFPTVHVHDLKVPTYAGFDHTLYAQWQGQASWRAQRELEAGTYPPNLCVELDRCHGLVANKTVWRVELRGRLANTDTVLRAPAAA